MNQQDKVSSIIVNTITCLFFACVLSVPFFGILPSLVAAAGILSGCYGFTALTSTAKPKEKKVCK